MEEHFNQVVPSTSCDWLDQFDDESSSNQVVPATVPVPTSLPDINPGVGDSDLQPIELPALDAAQHNPSPSTSSVVAIENSLKSLSLEGAQVVPSTSRSPTVDTLAMEVEMRTCASEILRPASKTSASKA